MRFQHYIQPGTVEEALQWAEKPNTVILGGMMWLRMQTRTVENAVDLSRLGLDRIEETEDGIRIGASVTLRQAETDPLLLSYTHGAMAAALSPIVGVQFRNTATIGGSVFGRFGFSDVCTILTALGASVVLAERGTIPMEQFMREGAPRDLLTHILLPKAAPDGAVSIAHRHAATDFPAVTAALCRRGDNIRVTLTPAPVRGETMDFSASQSAEIPALFTEKLTFRADRLGSAEYRAHLAKVLTRRGLTAIGG